MRVRDTYKQMAADWAEAQIAADGREKDANDAKLRLLEQVLQVSEEMENALNTLGSKSVPKRLVQDWYTALQVGKIRIITGKFDSIQEAVIAASVEESK